MKHLVAVLFAMLSLHAFSQIPDYVPADGLVAWYPFDQNFQDESDFGNDAVENGSVPFTDDRFENGESALSFSGNGNNFLRVNYSSDSYTFQSGFSASVWFTSNTTSGNRRVFSMGSTDASGKGFHVMKYSNEIGAWFCEGPGDPYFGNWDGNENTTFDIGEWNHLLFSCDFGNLNWTVFLNGDSVNGGTSGIDFDPNQLPVTFTQTFEIGRKSGTSNSGDAWNGVIDDLGIWSRPLTALEAEALYLSFNGIGGCTDSTACNYDASANWNDGTCLPSGCMDAQACNYNEDAQCEGEACDYTCCPGPGCCDDGTIWSWESQTCVVAIPAYLNEPGEAAILNPCYFDSNGNGLVEVTDLMNVLSVFGMACGEIPAAAFSCGDPLNYQGYDYATIQIGDQCWFAENLRAENYQNGDAIDNGVDPSIWSSVNSGLFTPAYGDLEDVEIWGMLYNGHAVLDPRKLCPSGWHVGSDSDFLELESHLGLDEGLNDYFYRGTSINLGGMFKEEGTLEDGTGFWHSPNTGANNSSGLSMRANGWRSPQGEYEAGGAPYGTDGNFWTSTFVEDAQYENDVDGGLIRRRCDHNFNGVQRDSYGVSCGFGVRCIQD